MTSPPPSDDLSAASEPAETPAPAEDWAPPEPPAGTPAESFPAPAAPLPLPPPGPGAPLKTNRLAIAALVTGLLGMLLLALGFGIAALVQISRRTDEKGKGLAIGGMVAGLAWTVLAILVALVTAATSLFGAERNASGQITEKGTILAGALRVGDCFSGLEPEAPDRLVTAVPCTRPHQGEVTATVTFPEAPWPGDTELNRRALEKCGQEHTRFQRSRRWGELNVQTVEPGATTWKAGDREVICLLVLRDATTLTTPLGDTLDPSLVPMEEMRLGDCFGKWDDEAAAQRKVSCTKPHWYEVYGFHMLKSGPYPGDKAVDARAEKGCDTVYQKAFESGRRPERVSWLYPLKEDWEQGRRRVVCLAAGDDRPLTKPFMSS